MKPYMRSGAVNVSLSLLASFAKSRVLTDSDFVSV